MHLAVPRQVYGDLFSNGIILHSLIHGVVPRSVKFAVARFFARISPRLHLLYTKNANKCQTFLRKIAKMFTINLIIRELTFFSTFFCKQSEKKVIFQAISLNYSKNGENCQTFFVKSKNVVSIRIADACPLRSYRT